MTSSCVMVWLSSAWQGCFKAASWLFVHKTDRWIVFNQYHGLEWNAGQDFLARFR